jgi:hypothetical protein
VIKISFVLLSPEDAEKAKAVGFDVSLEGGYWAAEVEKVVDFIRLLDTVAPAQGVEVVTLTCDLLALN